jgi:hypothetical protein
MFQKCKKNKQIHKGKSEVLTCSLYICLFQTTTNEEKKENQVEKHVIQRA